MNKQLLKKEDTFVDGLRDRTLIFTTLNEPMTLEDIKAYAPEYNWYEVEDACCTTMMSLEWYENLPYVMQKEVGATGVRYVGIWVKGNVTTMQQLVEIHQS
jgi:hypothetical protein